jgi:hypothetical protein
MSVRAAMEILLEVRAKNINWPNPKPKDARLFLKRHKRHADKNGVIHDASTMIQDFVSERYGAHMRRYYKQYDSQGYGRNIGAEWQAIMIALQEELAKLGWVYDGFHETLTQSK